MSLILVSHYCYLRDSNNGKSCCIHSLNSPPDSQTCSVESKMVTPCQRPSDFLDCFGKLR
uniref:Uncharacterized protein n=1 Tax=Arion vulgaris TaxID=1028688 RepID=A0A0B7C557_9EUPU